MDYLTALAPFLIFVACLIIFPLALGAWFTRNVPSPHTDEMKAQHEIVMMLMTQHWNALHTQCHRAAYRDPYGQWEVRPIRREVTRFFDSVVAHRRSFSDGNRAFWIDHLTFALLGTLDPEDDAGDPASALNDGLDYERAVADALTARGLGVSHTPRTGDQGVDLIADYGPTKVAVQCKCYSKPVGNDAVQQVYSGAAFYGAAVAVVVAPNGYTPAALALARQLRVICVHHDDLDFLMKVLNHDHVFTSASGAA